MCRSGLGRSTVREALRLLTSQHLITTTRGVTGGSFVASPSTADLADTLSTGLHLLLAAGPAAGRHLFEVREMIEMSAAARAATRADPEAVRALRAAASDPASDPAGGALPSGRAFHLALARASGNPLLELLAEPMYDVADERTLARYAPAGFWDRVDAEHRAIVEAVAAGDPGAARAAAAAHLVHLRDVRG